MILCLGVFCILKQIRRAGIRAFRLYGIINEVQAADMPCPQRMGRRVADVVDHVGVGINAAHLIEIRAGGDRLHTGVLPQVDIMQDDILDALLRHADHVGAAGAVVAAGDMLDHHPAQGAHRGLGQLIADAATVLQAHEDGAPGPLDVDACDQEVLQGAAVHHLQGDAGVGAGMLDAAHILIHAADLAVTHQHLPEIALGIGADLQGIAGGVQAAVLHQHPLGGTLGGGLEAQRVVTAAHVAAADDHVPAAVDVNAVVVVIRLIAHGDALQQHLIAVEVVLHPAGSVPQGDIMHMHAFAVHQTDEEGAARGTVLCLAAGEIVLGAAAVDLAGAAEADILAALGEDQRLVHAHVGVLYGDAPADVLREVREVGAGQQAAAFIHHQPDVATQHQRAGHIVALGQQHRTAALVSGTINSRLGTSFDFKGDIAPFTYIFDLLTTLQNEGCIADYGIQNEIGGNIEADWIAYGDAAIVMLTSNQFQALSAVAAESGITLDLCTLPRVYPDGQSGMVVRSSQQMSMYSGSENKELAANFINFFANSIEANKILNCERGVSVNSDVLAALREVSDEVNAKVYAAIDLIGSFPDAANSSPAEPACAEELRDVLKSTYLQGLAEGKFESAEDAAAKFWAEAQEIWKKYE